MKLKTHATKTIQPFHGHRSDAIAATNVPISVPWARDWYMTAAHHLTVPAPTTSSSAFVPRALIAHLMRRKKDSALGVKFQAGRSPPDAITNMEGALHSFVTPIVLAFMHGDYRYRYGHGKVRFEATSDGVQRARTVLISAQIQPDFEGGLVLLALAVLGDESVEGGLLPEDFEILDVVGKQDEGLLLQYEASLRRHMVASLTKDGRLPSLREAAPQTIDVPAAIALLETTILSSSSSPTTDNIRHAHVRLPDGPVLSLDLLLNTALHQLHNELSALELLSPQGYVYTSDPPSIFARRTGATLLNRLQFAALKLLASENSFANMRVFAFNDYADKKAVSLLGAALASQPHVMVRSKSELFEGKPVGTYGVLEGAEGALLVIHNNNDAFGQNIETEWEGGSMDGAIGVNSSAAASLKRDRPDLVSHLM